ncbi:MJ0042-type zinc finger domain-containing protein [Qipengyuania nanhaisediminis]|uniref:zinc-ribbon domain-containing protein n=1 Tax=Qipengyuania nanhaisediminis TaxID=604088 RepID=UPI0038B24745
MRIAAARALVCAARLAHAAGAMIISCPACGTRYVVPETAIGGDGRTVRCAKCKHSWHQDPQPADTARPREQVAKAAAARTGATPAPTPAPTSSPAPAPAQPPAPAPAPPHQGSEPGSAEEPSGPSIDHWRNGEHPDTGRAADAGAGGIGAAALASRDEPSATTHEHDEDTAIPDTLASPHDDAHDDAHGPGGYDYDDSADAHEGSSFDYSPPFTRRRNSLKMWTIAAAAFAVLATGTVVAVNYYGLPEWVPIQRPTFGVGEADLALDFPDGEQRKERLENGEEIFRVRGTIANTGSETIAVPNLLVVFRDERERNVGNWIVVPAKRELAPGESLNVAEAITDIPPAARAAYIGWAPN